ncbi:sulfotransferase [Xanthomarina gelatinilytica]|uniref:sulfotransferase n=1 Tax=Xanthomarina gelatinilytica TaxID=1137281 RepID=UPI003AA7FC10
MNNWIAPDTNLLPDFIIGGAMKSGTSTIHNILEKHPKVFIPKKEIGFFDIDNILEHSDFNFFTDNKWVSQSMDNDPEKMWRWYQEKFKGKETSLKGSLHSHWNATGVELVSKKILDLYFN